MIKKILSSEFNRHVLTLLTGTAVAQVIPIAVSPLLTRLYTPEDFGVLALYVSIITIIISVANGRYELAIMLPEKDEDVINVAALALMISSSISFLLLIVVFIFNQKITRLLKNDQISFWLYFVPVSVFFGCIYIVLTQLNSRLKQYNDIAKSNIVRSVSTAVVQLSAGMFKAGVAGLISGQIISVFNGNWRLSLNIIRNFSLMEQISLKRIKELGIRYIDFPKFSVWGVLANNLTYNLTNILISSVYSASTLGFYSLGNRIIGMPSMLIGTSVGQVYFREAFEEKLKTGKAIVTLKSTLKKLVVISVPGFFILYFIVEELFAFFFGENWRIAGTYAKILIPLFAVRFVVSPVSITNSVFEKQRVSLVWQFFLFFMSIGSFGIAKFFNLSMVQFLHIFNISLCITYLIFLVIIFKHANGEYSNK